MSTNQLKLWVNIQLTLLINSGKLLKISWIHNIVAPDRGIDGNKKIKGRKEHIVFGTLGPYGGRSS